MKGEKMNTALNKIAAVLAFIIGAMAIFAGGQVLLGKDPGYYVISWLPIYNFTLGLVSFFITALLIWKDSKYARSVVVGTLSLHAVIMAILQISYQTVVAADSIRAMTIRLIVWLIILALMFVQERKKSPAAV
jgi:hypothetical protein